MARHAKISDEELEPNPWVAGLITGIMVALIFVIAFTLLARIWLG